MTLVVERALDLVGILLVFVTGAILVGELPPGWSYGLAVALAGILALMTVLVCSDASRMPRWVFGGV
jgi:hypothetical protein